MQAWRAFPGPAGQCVQKDQSPLYRDDPLWNITVGSMYAGSRAARGKKLQDAMAVPCGSEPASIPYEIQNRVCYMVSRYLRIMADSA